MLLFNLVFISFDGGFSSSIHTTKWLLDRIHLHCEVKDTALILTSGLDLDSTVVHADEVLADHQAEAYAFTVHFGGPTKFAELGEQLGHLLLLNALACVHNVHNKHLVDRVEGHYDAYQASSGEF